MSAGRVPSQATQACTATLAGKLVSILALSGSSEHAGGASRVSFADPDRSVFRAPLGALVWGCAPQCVERSVPPTRLRARGLHVRFSPTHLKSKGL